jgi:hypothetical protein
MNLTTFLIAVGAFLIPRKRRRSTHVSNLYLTLARTGIPRLAENGLILPRRFERFLDNSANDATLSQLFVCDLTNKALN